MESRPDYFEFDSNSKHVHIDPLDDRFVQEPYNAYAFLNRNAPIFFWCNYGFWCLADFNGVNRLLRDRRLGRAPPSKPAENRGHLQDFDHIEAHSLLDMEPPAHTRLRNLVNRAFVSRQIERLRPRIGELAHGLVDRVENRGETDLIAAFATPVPIAIITEMLGLPLDDGDQLLNWSHTMVAMYMHGRKLETELGANRAAAEFSRYLKQRIAERRQSPGDDLLSQLIAARDYGEKLSEDELISTSILLLNAGHEATVHQIGNAVLTILRQGGDPRRWFEGKKTTADTVEECLRIDPPLHLFTRYAYEPIDIGGDITIEPGAQIGLLLGAANRDPAAFLEPQEFQPGRDDQKNVSFGAGIHFCLGAPLARLELQVAVKVLFERLPTMRLVEEPRYRPTYHFHGLERLQVAW